MQYLQNEIPTEHLWQAGALPDGLVFFEENLRRSVPLGDYPRNRTSGVAPDHTTTEGTQVWHIPCSYVSLCAALQPTCRVTDSQPPLRPGGGWSRAPPPPRWFLSPDLPPRLSVPQQTGSFSSLKTPKQPATSSSCYYFQQRSNANC